MKSNTSNQQIVRTLLERHGVTFAQELKIKLDRQTPSELFKLLCALLLFSARIGHELASRAAAALFQKGWTHPRKMAAASWQQRARALNEAGYARYDERTSTMLEQTSRLLLNKYGGDLKKLREQAGRDPAAERKLLKEFKGIGDVGVDIFFREAQAFGTSPSPTSAPCKRQTNLVWAKTLTLSRNSSRAATSPDLSQPSCEWHWNGKRTGRS